MRFKLDENIPVRTKGILEGLGHDAESVYDEDLAGLPDPEIWKVCQLEDRLLITQDLDFSDVRTFQPGTHSGILLVRMGHSGRNEIFNRLLHVLNATDLSEWHQALVVLTDRTLRVRRP